MNPSDPVFDLPLIPSGLGRVDMEGVVVQFADGRIFEAHNTDTPDSFEWIEVTGAAQMAIYEARFRKSRIDATLRLYD